MDDIISLIFQGIFNALRGLFALVWYSRPFPCEDQGPWQKGMASLGSFVLGVVIGGLSLLFFPDTLFHSVWLRLALTIALPLILGFVARETARSHQEHQSSMDPSFRFWITLAFSVGFVWVRFTYSLLRA